MGIYNAINACAHLTNVANARLGMTSLPSTKVNLMLATALHRAGFISNVRRGGAYPPTPEELQNAIPSGSFASPDSPASPEPATHANAATRRIWLGMKYWDDKPVLRRMQTITKPKRPITLKVKELHRVVRGFPSSDGFVKGLKIGEAIFVMTDKGLLEGREAISRGLGGLVVCKASGGV